MIEAARIVMDSLEKLNIILYSLVLIQSDIDKGKKVVITITSDVKVLEEQIDMLRKLLKQKEDITDQLTLIIKTFNAFIRKYKKIDDLITIAAQMHVANMDAEGYSDEE